MTVIAGPIDSLTDEGRESSAASASAATDRAAALGATCLGKELTRTTSHLRSFAELSTTASTSERPSITRA